MDSIVEAKQNAAKEALKYIKEGMLVGLGSGSTSSFFIKYLGQSGLKVKGIASSKASEKLARRYNIPLLDSEQISALDIDVDGADEVDSAKRMIKGGGGALLREKIVATMSHKMIVVVDESKCVKKLGAFPLPVEIIPFCFKATVSHLKQLGFKGALRKNKKGDLYLTDNKNLILDIHWERSKISAEKTDALIRSIPGVVETGFFLNLATLVIVGKKNGEIAVF